ncbi:MAG: GC-type dockerin domain-anchored protein [Planctomycetota bacterium]
MQSKTRHQCIAAALAASLGVAHSTAQSVAMPDIEPLSDTFPGPAFIPEVVDDFEIVGTLDDRGCGQQPLLRSAMPTGPFPDTRLGVQLLGATQFTSNDDGGPYADRLGSALIDLPAPFPVLWAVSGFNDLDFDGNADLPGNPPHGQLGPFELVALVRTPARGITDRRVVASNTFTTGEEAFIGPRSSNLAGLEDPGALLSYIVNNQPGVDLGCRTPDTLMRALDSAGDEIRRSDDASPLGTGDGSALFGIALALDPNGVEPPAAVLELTGDGNHDFDPAFRHDRLGEYTLEITFRDALGIAIETRILPDELLDRADFRRYRVPAPPEAITYDAIVNNDPAGCAQPVCVGDRDFITIEGLRPNGEIIVEVTQAEFDPLIVQLDANGQTVQLADDNLETGSRLPMFEALTDGAGTLHLAVTAFPDRGVGGLHTASGGYRIRLIDNIPPLLGCNPADVAAPFFVVNISDLFGYINEFVKPQSEQNDAITDANRNGVVNISDLFFFIEVFTSGAPCPQPD